MSATIGHKDDHAGVINGVMKRMHLDKKDIDPKEESRYKRIVHGVGKFLCTHCPDYGWISRFSWIRIDLYDQRISYRWSMKCIQCRSIEKPDFSLAEFERLVEKAVCLYKGLPLPRYKGRNPLWPPPEPHLPELCEKCGWGTTQCWIYRNYGE